MCEILYERYVGVTHKANLHICVIIDGRLQLGTN